MVKKTTNNIRCAPCNVAMKLTMLSNYEFEEGIQLKNVSAYQCPHCNEIFFTEEQAHEMEQHTDTLLIKTT